ncbi:hypothetical protein GLOIN_2v1763573 [Rhizophagus irregularis DAOM 181602=DAOM 197198]|nr:hypothetical protein GLOIN_2v1763573 [Rhizophagus irregularis DAOM 181602=DAOM 197198]
MTKNNCLQDEPKLGTITIYLNFISFYANEFVQDLDFFQQSKKPVIPFAELRLQQLTSYIEFKRNSSNFGSLENLIIQLRFNPEDFYVIFRLGNNEVLGEIELNQYWLNKPKLL